VHSVKIYIYTYEYLLCFCSLLKRFACQSLPVIDANGSESLSRNMQNAEGLLCRNGRWRRYWKRYDLSV